MYKNFTEIVGGENLTVDDALKLLEFDKVAFVEEQGFDNLDFNAFVLK